MKIFLLSLGLLFLSSYAQQHAFRFKEEDKDYGAHTGLWGFDPHYEEWAYWHRITAYDAQGKEIGYIENNIRNPNQMSNPHIIDGMQGQDIQQILRAKACKYAQLHTINKTIR